MSKIFTACLLLILSVQSFATERATFGVRGERLPVYQLVTFVSDPQETEDDFVLRVGTFLTRYSQQSGFEACASLVQRADGRLVASVTSNESHIGCVAVITTEGEETGRSIHSHPESGNVRLNLADNTFLRGDQGRQGNARRESMRTMGGVSPTDRLSGSGYLVEKGRVVFFSRNAPDRLVGPIAASPLAPSLLASSAPQE